jgi:hypothetical protein
VSTFLYSAITVSEAGAYLNDSGPVPFAVVDLDAATHTALTMHTAAEARALAAAFEAAAVLLEEHAAQTGEVAP